MINWLQLHWIELAGTFFAFLYLFLSIKENIWLWVAGFFSSGIYLVVFFQSQLYADMGLQVYYLIVSIYGWFYWLGGNKSKIETSIATISINNKYWVKLLFLIFVLTGVFYLLLKTVPGYLGLTDSSLPMGDAFTTAASVVATWMLARKMLQNWLIWIVVNVVSMGMYVYKNLYVTSFLFLVYTIMAVVGYIKWKRNMQKP